MVMMMATLLLISLAAAAPSIYVEGQREKEKDLIFRGEQYARAIILFHQQFKRYPTSVKELLHTNNLSFLRQAYPDPMTRSGKWRFIHATANGVVLDSKILKPPGQQNNKPLGDNSNAAGSQSTPAAPPTKQPATQNSSQNGGFTMGNFPLPGQGQNSGQNQQGNKGSSFFSNNKTLGTFIVGVASTSNHHSIGVFAKRTEYDEWEFLGIPGAPGAPNIMGTGAVPGVGAQPGQSPNGLPGSNPNSGGGFHLGPSQTSQPSQPGSIFGGDSNR
jgi:type II secretory pathway pseudopilin PulG